MNNVQVTDFQDSLVICLLCLIMLYSQVAFIFHPVGSFRLHPTRYQEFGSLTAYLGFRPFPRLVYRFYSFHNSDCFDSLGQSNLPILISGFMAIWRKCHEIIKDAVYISCSGCSFGIRHFSRTCLPMSSPY